MKQAKLWMLAAVLTIYGQSYYKPMLEVFDYLKTDFTFPAE